MAISKNYDDSPYEVCVKSFLSLQVLRPTSITPNDHEFIVIATVDIDGSQTSKYVFQQSRRDFLSATKDEQRDIIITKSIANLEIPFCLEKIRWGFNSGKKPRPAEENLEEIEEKILEQARLCAEDNVDKRDLIIFIQKRNKVKVNAYRKEPLEDWQKDNNKDVNLQRYIEILYHLCHISPAENRDFGLKSVTVTENSPDSCSICFKDLKRGRQAIGLPCSHIFHGYCIIEWISKTLTEENKKWYDEKLRQAFPDWETKTRRSQSTMNPDDPSQSTKTTPTPRCPCRLCRFDLISGKYPS